MLQGRAKLFFAMGGNFLQATPDTQRTAQALENCEMLVHVSTKLNRGHLIHNKWTIILPCLARSEIDSQAYGEQFVTVENSMGVVHSSQGHLKPAHPELYSEPAIIAWLRASPRKAMRLSTTRQPTTPATTATIEPMAKSGSPSHEITSPISNIASRKLLKS